MWCRLCGNIRPQRVKTGQCPSTKKQLDVQATWNLHHIHNYKQPCLKIYVSIPFCLHLEKYADNNESIFKFYCKTYKISKLSFYSKQDYTNIKYIFFLFPDDEFFIGHCLILFEIFRNKKKKENTKLDDSFFVIKYNHTWCFIKGRPMLNVQDHNVMSQKDGKRGLGTTFLLVATRHLPSNPINWCFFPGVCSKKHLSLTHNLHCVSCVWHSRDECTWDRHRVAPKKSIISSPRRRIYFN